VTGDVLVKATTVAQIFATVQALAATAAMSGGSSTAVGMGVAVADNQIGYKSVAPSTVDFNSDGTQRVNLVVGNIVRVKGENALAGGYYKLVSTRDRTLVDLSIEDYSDEKKWKRVDLVGEAAAATAEIVGGTMAVTGDMSVLATAGQSVVATVSAIALAISAGKSGVAFSGAGSSAKNRILGGAIAQINGTTSVSAHDLILSAQDTSIVRAWVNAASIAAAIGQTATAGSIGVGVALNEVENSVTAKLNSAGTVTLTGGLSITALASPPPSFSVARDTITADQLNDATETSMTTSGSDTVIDAVDVTSDALIVTTLLNRLNSGLPVGQKIEGNVRLSRQQDEEGWVLVDGLGRTFLLSLVGNNLTADASTIDSVAQAASMSVAVGQSGVAISGAGAVSTNDVRSSSSAELRGSKVSAGGAVSVTAQNLSSINASVLAASAAVAVGSTGVGASIGVAVVMNRISGLTADTPVRVRAIIDQSDVTAIGALTVSATADAKINASSFAGSVAVAAGSTGVALSGSGVFVQNQIDIFTSATISGQYGATPAGQAAVKAASITVQASSLSEIKAYGGAASVAVALGSTGVAVSIGASIVENRIGGSTSAGITDIARGVEAGAISVSAADQSDIRATAQAASISAAFGSTALGISGAGAFATNTITAAVLAEVVGAKATGTTLAVTANSAGTLRATVQAASAAVAVGATGVGASIGVAVAKNLIGYSAVAVETLNPTYRAGTARPTLISSGQTVLIEKGGRENQVFRYIGNQSLAAGGGIDLSTQDYSNPNLWEDRSLSREPA